MGVTSVKGVNRYITEKIDLAETCPKISTISHACCISIRKDEIIGQRGVLPVSRGVNRYITEKIDLAKTWLKLYVYRYFFSIVVIKLCY